MKNLLMKKFKAEIIVRTDEFCHIAPQVEGTLEEIVGVHDELKNMLEAADDSAS